MGLMQARWTMKCACGCGETIYAGSQFSASSGKVYKPRHLERMRKTRKV